jgi:hypothetical protein
VHKTRHIITVSILAIDYHIEMQAKIASSPIFSRKFVDWRKADGGVFGPALTYFEAGQWRGSWLG